VTRDTLETQAEQFAASLTTTVRGIAPDCDPFATKVMRSETGLKGSRFAKSRQRVFSYASMLSLYSGSRLPTSARSIASVITWLSMMRRSRSMPLETGNRSSGTSMTAMR
jgi:hypothetical protein